LSDKIKILSDGVLNGNHLAIAKSMTLIENEQDSYQELLDSLHRHTGNSYRIGITGPPGVGKSTITNQMAKILRRNNFSLGIVAVDPTSSFSGGAILGDRVRMNDLTLDNGVFIRSMATRGSSGGLARKANEVADILDAAGYNYIIYETVGVGQVELDIANAADTTIVMMVPEGGDIIQGMKSGLMEIGDIFVVNKADRPGAEQMQQDLVYALHLKKPSIPWNPEVILTIANRGKGILDLWEQIQKHKQFLNDNDLLDQKRDKRLEFHIKALIRDEITKRFWNNKREKVLNDYFQSMKDKISPYKLVEHMLSELIKKIE